jgi:hypothetical protein
VDGLSSTTGILAVAGVAVAVAALLVAGLLALRLRTLHRAQLVILGDQRRDLVAHAADLDAEFSVLTRYVQDATAQLQERMTIAEERIDHAVAYRSLVRYDAYGEMSGRQSTSIALLDATRSGIVLSSIHHRETARLYAKQINAGTAQIQLSPEEEQAMRIALGEEQPDEGTS